MDAAGDDSGDRGWVGRLRSTALLTDQKLGYDCGRGGGDAPEAGIQHLPHPPQLCCGGQGGGCGAIHRDPAVEKGWPGKT
jgi:hypothetical protein